MVKLVGELSEAGGLRKAELHQGREGNIYIRSRRRLQSFSKPGKLNHAWRSESSLAAIFRATKWAARWVAVENVITSGRQNSHPGGDEEAAGSCNPFQINGLLLKLSM